MINDASVVIGGGNWGIKEADVLGYKLINDEYYARDIDFANSTAAGTYTDSTGVVRRAPYNLLQQSDTFDNASWSKLSSSISSNVTTAPNATLTADKLVEDSTTATHQIFQNTSILASTNYNYSVYLKAAEIFRFRIRFIGQSGAQDSNVDLNAGTASAGTLISVGSGWFRLTWSVNSGTGANSPLVSIALQDASGNNTYLGNGTSGAFIWGAQLVEGTEALPYFPTTTRLNVPRIDYRNADGSLSTTGRLLLEPQRTNSIRNSSMVGAVAGSPGTLPTNWSSSTSGLVQTVVGAGVENGLPYVDLRFAGTAIATLVRIFSETSTQIAAVNAQTWGHSIYVKRISGTFDSTALGYAIRGAGGTGLGAPTSPITVTTSLQRFSYVAAVNNASTQFVQPLIDFYVTIGQTYDFTIRIAAPQMELGAYATTWIPTTTAAVTRNADVASRTGVSSWIGQTEGTLFIDIELPQLTGPSSAILISLGGPTQPRIYIAKEVSTTNVFQLGIQNAAGAYNFVNTAAITTPNIKFAIAYASGNNAFYVNGALISTASANANATSLSSINMGAITNAHQYKVNQAIIFPTRLTNSQLQSLTTL